MANFLDDGAARARHLPELAYTSLDTSHAAMAGRSGGVCLTEPHEAPGAMVRAGSRTDQLGLPGNALVGPFLDPSLLAGGVRPRINAPYLRFEALMITAVATRS